MPPEEIETKEEIEEAVLVERKALEYEAKDDDLIKAIEDAVAEAKTLKEKMDKAGERNETYWKRGTEIKDTEIHPKRAKIINNRIFMAVETILPIITSRTPEPSIVGNLDNDLREKLIKVLTIAYEVKQKLQEKLQKVIRHWFLYFIGVWKYRWDEGFITETVRPEKIGFDPRAPEKGICEFIYEQMEATVEELMEKFPDKKDDIKAKYGEERKKSKVKYIEFWGGGGEWVAWKLGKILLDKKKNPNFDYTNKENNLFKKAQFPYLFLNVFSLGKTLYDDTSLIGQVRSLQDGVNKRKNQISDLTEENKKLIVASSEAISKEEFQKFINKYGMVGIWLDHGNVNQIQIVGGKAEPWVFDDLAQSIGEIDNIMGTHSTTRGEREKQETLGGRKLLMSSDYGRIDLIIRKVEQVMEDWFNAYLHMLKVYSLEDNEFSNGEETITLTKNEIPQGILVMVKKGSTLPVDKASRAEMAVKLAQFDKIDPETLFDELGYGKVEERANKLYEWLKKTGKIVQEAAGLGGGGGSPEEAQLARLKEIMTSDKFKQLPPAKQKAMVKRAREIVKRIKGGK